MHPGKVCLLIAASSVPLQADALSQIAEDLQRGELLQSEGRFVEAERQFRSAMKAV